MSNEIAWPLKINVIRKRSLHNTFGNVRIKHGKAAPHQGWDFEAKIGTPIYAISGGKIEFVTGDAGDYGKQICMSFACNGKTYYAFYAHLSIVNVKVGDEVKINDVIGASGDTGNARGMEVADQHLHFEIRTADRLGKGLAGQVSPMQIFNKCPLKTPISG